MQIPMTCSLANAPWQNYKACHDFLGILPLTTGQRHRNGSRQQLEIAFRYGTNMWVSFPEYLTRLAEVCRGRTEARRARAQDEAPADLPRPRLSKER
jgi:hypothetical protein